ncbi:titin isoform X4 [Dermacentor silvarum]|nr:titin isoform X4 [Dermacentor silvarum]
METKHLTEEAVAPVPELEPKEITKETEREVPSIEKTADEKEQLLPAPTVVPEVPKDEAMAITVPTEPVAGEEKAPATPARQEPVASVTREIASAEPGKELPASNLEEVAPPKIKETELSEGPAQEMLQLNVVIEISPASLPESEKKDEDEKPTAATASEIEEHATKDGESAETTQGKTEAPETPEVVLDEEKRVREILEFEMNLCRARNLGSALPKAEELLHVGTPVSEPAESAELALLEEKLAQPPGTTAVPTESPKADTLAPSTLESGQADIEPAEPILDAADFNKGPMSDWETELQQLRDSRLHGAPYRAGEQGKAPPADAAVGARKFIFPEGEGKKVPEEKQVTIPPEAEGGSPGPNAPSQTGLTQRESVVIVYESDTLGMVTPDYEIRLKNEREIRIRPPEQPGTSAQLHEGPPRSFFRPDADIEGGYPKSPVIHHVSFTREEGAPPPPAGEKPEPVEREPVEEKEVKPSMLSLPEGTLDTEQVAEPVPSASSFASAAGAEPNEKRTFLGAKEPSADEAHPKDDGLSKVPTSPAEKESEVMPEHRGVETPEEKESAEPKPEADVSSRVFLPTHKPSTEGESEPTAEGEAPVPDKVKAEESPRTFLSAEEPLPPEAGRQPKQEDKATEEAREAMILPEKQLEEKADRPKGQDTLLVPRDELHDETRTISEKEIESALEAARALEPPIAEVAGKDVAGKESTEEQALKEDSLPVGKMVERQPEKEIEPTEIDALDLPIAEVAGKDVAGKASEEQQALNEGTRPVGMMVERQPEKEIEPTKIDEMKVDETMIIVPREELATDPRATRPREVEPVVTQRAAAEVETAKVAGEDEGKAPSDLLVERTELRQMAPPTDERKASVVRAPVVEQVVVPVHKRPSDAEKPDASTISAIERDLVSAAGTSMEEPKRSTPMSKDDLHPGVSSDWDVMSRESLQGRPGTRTADTQTELSTDVRSKDVREASTYAFLSEETEEVRRAPDDYLPLYLHRVTLNDKPSIAEMMRKLTPASEEWEEAVPMNWKINPAKDLEKWPSHCMQDVRTPTIVLLGGINLSALGEVLTGCLVLRYNLEENEWRRCNMMPLPRYGHRCVFLNNEIYVIGGFDNRDATYGLRMSTSFCFRYHTQTGEWNVVAPLRHARGYHNVAVLNNAIYAVGGVDANDLLLSSVERYDREEDTWVVLEKGLYCGRMGMGVAAFQGCLWVVGGIVQIAGLQTCSTAYVEIYNPATDQEPGVHHWRPRRGKARPSVEQRHQGARAHREVRLGSAQGRAAAHLGLRGRGSAAHRGTTVGTRVKHQPRCSPSQDTRSPRRPRASSGPAQSGIGPATRMRIVALPSFMQPESSGEHECINSVVKTCTRLLESEYQTFLSVHSRKISNGTSTLWQSLQTPSLDWLGVVSVGLCR